MELAHDTLKAIQLAEYHPEAVPDQGNSPPHRTLPPLSPFCSNFRGLRNRGPRSSTTDPVFILLFLPPASPSLSIHRESSVPTRTGIKPKQVCWCCRESGHFQDQCSLMELGTLIRNPDGPALNEAETYHIQVSI